MPQKSQVNAGVDRTMADRSDCEPTESTKGRLSSTVLQNLRSECAAVWFDSGVYERAESHYYVKLQESQNGTTSAASSKKPKETCNHGDQDACHHVLHTVWVNKPSFDQAESNFVAQHPKQPNSVTMPSSLQLFSTSPSSSTLCDEGYSSQTPTPATPATPALRQINGLPLLPAPLHGVWFQKPLYDRAEAAYYQSLYQQNEPQCKTIGKNEGKKAACKNLSATVDKERKSISPQQQKQHNDSIKKEGDRAWCHFLHVDSERVWLDRSRYVEAETRFYENVAAKTCQTAVVLTSPSQKMSCVDYLAQERIWFDKPRYDEAERKFYERMNGPTLPAQESGSNSILQDIARARENIQKSLAGTSGGSSADQGELLARMNNLELENQSLHKVVEELRTALSKLESRVSVLEKRPAAPVPLVNGTASNKATPTPQKTLSAPAKSDDEEEDDDIDLFGSDEEVDEEAERLKEQRLQEYAAKKAKKPALIAKSSILLDVKPWDDETDMAKLEQCVRSVQVDGLLWGASKLVPVGYGIKKLQINCVVEDDKVGTDLLEEEITKFEDYVQSVDVAAFNKI